MTLGRHEQGSQRAHVFDFALNEQITTLNYNVVLDSTPPTISLGSVILSNSQNHVSVPISINETNSVTTTVKVNSNLIYTTNDKNFTFEYDLPSGSNYVLEVSSIDAAGNQSTSTSMQISKDTTAPVVAFNIQPNILTKTSTLNILIILFKCI